MWIIFPLNMWLLYKISCHWFCGSFQAVFRQYWTGVKYWGKPAETIPLDSSFLVQEVRWKLHIWKRLAGLIKKPFFLCPKYCTFLFLSHIYFFCIYFSYVEQIYKYWFILFYCISECSSCVHVDFNLCVCVLVNSEEFLFSTSVCKII